MSDLKPCPFCGGLAYVTPMHITEKIYMVRCWKCKAIVSFEGNEAKKKCIEAWNRRDTHDD